MTAMVMVTSGAGKEILKESSRTQHSKKNASLCFQDVNGAKILKHLKNIQLFMILWIGFCVLLICFVTLNQSHVIVRPRPYDSQALCHRLPFPELGWHFPKPETFDRGECSCTPVHYFVLVSMQRSGSGWFETLLNNHPNITSHGEIFNPRERMANFSTICKTLDAVYNLDWLSSAAKNTCTSAVGLKWMINQGLMEYNREISTYFKQRGVSIIFLFRRNHLRRLVSILANTYDRDRRPLKGTHKSHVHSKEEAVVLAGYKPIINVANLVEYLKYTEKLMNDTVDAFKGIHHTKIYYEDLVKDPKRSIEVQEFLGVPIQELRSKQVRIHTRPLSQQVKNWDAVREKLKGNKFKAFLQD